MKDMHISVQEQKDLVLKHAKQVKSTRITLSLLRSCSSFRLFAYNRFTNPPKHL